MNEVDARIKELEQLQERYEMRRKQAELLARELDRKGEQLAQAQAEVERAKSVIQKLGQRWADHLFAQRYADEDAAQALKRSQAELERLTGVLKEISTMHVDWAPGVAKRALALAPEPAAPEEE